MTYALSALGAVLWGAILLSTTVLLVLLGHYTWENTRAAHRRGLERVRRAQR